MSFDKTYKLNKKQKPSSQRWIMRHLNDPYVHRAAAEGYRCRSAFKLQEIQSKTNLIKEKSAVLDLGCAPGGWSQIAAKHIFPGRKDHNDQAIPCSQGMLMGIDRLVMQPIPHVIFHQGDILDPAIQSLLALYQFDIILSDMAPSLTGHTTTDRLQMEELMEMVWEIAQEKLSDQGSLVMKAFHGFLSKEISPFFDKVFYFKPESSRSTSREIYLIAQGFKKSLYQGQNP